MTRSINDFADQLNRSYATEQNARRAFAKLVTVETAGAHLVLQRTDGRWVNIIINPDPTAWLYFAHNGVGVWS